MSAGLFDAVSLGGVGTWQQAATNLFPELSTARELSELRRWTTSDRAVLEEISTRRDRKLARYLQDDMESDETEQR